MNEIWDELDLLLAAHAPKLFASLRPPATEAQIAEVERHMGVQFPDELRAAYQRHDGTQGNESLLGGSYTWVDLNAMGMHWDSWSEIFDDLSEDVASNADMSFVKPSDKVLFLNWQRGWIPIGYPATNALICVDTAPGPSGILGQVISWEVTMGPRPNPYADSFCSFLQLIVDGLQNGKIMYDEQGGARGGMWRSTRDGEYIADFYYTNAWQ